MKLSKSSWHYRLHKAMYGKWARDPKNFCPYFWKTIVLGSLFIIPLAILYAPPRIVQKLLPEDWETPEVEEEGYFSAYLLYAIVMNLIFTFVFSMVAIWFVGFANEKMSFIQAMAVLGYIFLGITIVVWGWAKLKNRRRHGNVVQTESKPNVLVEGIKAWYKRNCPLIQWDEEKTQLETEAVND